MLKNWKNLEKKMKLVKMFLKCAFRKEYMEYIFILVYWKQSKVYLMIFLPYFYIWKRIYIINMNIYWKNMKNERNTTTWSEVKYRNLNFFFFDYSTKLPTKWLFFVLFIIYMWGKISRYRHCHDLLSELVLLSHLNSIK